jgi:hypothetical protein
MSILAKPLFGIFVGLATASAHTQLFFGLGTGYVLQSKTST